MRREEAVKVLEKAIKQEEKEKAIKEEEEEKAIKVCCEKVGGTSVGRESDILVIEWIGVLPQYISAKNIYRRKSAADAVTSSATAVQQRLTATVQQRFNSLILQEEAVAQNGVLYDVSTLFFLLAFHPGCFSCLRSPPHPKMIQLRPGAACDSGIKALALD